MEGTDENSWQTDTCRSQDGTKHCFFSHLFNMGGNYFWEIFESRFATEYMMFPVNDGKNDNYQQPTIKERCIAYLKDLRDGKTETTEQCFKDYDNSRICNISQMGDQC